MEWRKCTFLEAVELYLNWFKEHGTWQRFGLVWRTPDEYNVMEEWFLEKIKGNFDGSTLRVVLWLNHKEAAQLLDALRGGDLCR